MNDGIPDPIDVALGARVRLFRVLRGLSQDELAKAVGVTFQQVQKYERGTNRVSASAAARIAKRLELSMSDLFGEAAQQESIGPHAEALAEPGALELLKGFAALDDEGLKAALVQTVEAASRRRSGG